MRMIPVNAELVQDLLLHLNPYKPIGPVGIHPRILKELADVIERPLSMIFEQFWESGGVPVGWKLVNVPVFMEGNKDDLGNMGLSVSL